jgi:hypothetical protein
MKHFIKIGIIFFVLLQQTLYAQRDKVEYLSNFDKAPVRWGFYLGLNYNDYNISYKAPEQFPNAYIETDPKMGFNLGLIGSLRLNDNIDLRIEPGLMTNSKTLYFRHLGNSVDSIRNASGTFLHIPVLVQFSANRIHNIRPYVAAGVGYDYNFASNFNNPDDNLSGEFRMQKSNFMYELAVGMDFYFYYFKFSPSIRGVFALNNELKDDEDPNSPWTKPVDYFGTRGVFIQFTFQ